MNNKDSVANSIWPIIIFISLVIFSFLVWWIYFKQTAVASGDWVSFLPYLNCAFNTITSILLVLGVRAIKSNKIKSHRNYMISAGINSALFLISYLLYHHFHGDTKFVAQGVVKPIYFFILISHIALSVVQVPLIIGTFTMAFLQKWDVHRKVAIITYPIWLYVSVTGILVFIFLKAFNP